MQVIDTIEGMRAARARITGRVGLVPTMGALHAGHISLVEQACAENDTVIVTIFVNPTQFGPNEDFASYPRDLAHDTELLRGVGVDVVFTPTREMIYPAGFQTWIEVTDVTQGLEGERRPGHFKGVATVVAKLFNLTQPHMAYFGQKDAQQVAVLKHMTRDLNFPLTVAVCPTKREPDGLAMSSRNTYLTAEQRQVAPVLYRALQSATAIYEQGEHNPDKLRQIMMDTLQSEPMAQPDYVSVANAHTLRELEAPVDEPLLLSMAVRIGRTRLIDNCLLPAHLNDRSGLSLTLGG